MIPAELNKILKFFKDKGLEGEQQPETGQIFIKYKMQDNSETPIFFNLAAGGDLLQMFAPLPFKVVDEYVEDIARTLHLINKEIDIPGLGMDESSKIIFFRCLSPIYQKKVQEELLEAYVKSTIIVIETFGPLIYFVSQGKRSFEEIATSMQQYREQE